MGLIVLQDAADHKAAPMTGATGGLRPDICLFALGPLYLGA